MNPYINEDWTPERPYSIYSHTSPKGKVYIGLTKHKNLYQRWGSKGRRYSNHTVFTRAIKKYGWDNFEHKIIRTGLTCEEAQALERELIAFYKSLKMSYNMDDGGASNPKPAYGNKGATGMKRIHHKLLGKEKHIWPEEMEEYMSQGWEPGFLPATKAKTSAKKKGNTNTEGHLLSEETKRKIAATSKGRVHTDKSRNKLKNASIGRVAVNNGKENRLVPKEDLDTFLSQGYKLGYDKKLSKKNKIIRRIWITNGVKNKTIDKIRLKEFEDKGWWRGKTRD